MSSEYIMVTWVFAFMELSEGNLQVCMRGGFLAHDNGGQCIYLRVLLYITRGVIDM